MAFAHHRQQQIRSHERTGDAAEDVERIDPARARGIAGRIGIDQLRRQVAERGAERADAREQSEPVAVAQQPGPVSGVHDPRVVDQHRQEGHDREEGNHAGRGPWPAAAQIPPVEQRTDEGRTQVGEDHRRERIHLRAQHRSERPGPDHLHRHGDESRGEQQPPGHPGAERPGWGGRGLRIRRRARPRRGDRGPTAARSKPRADEHDREVPRRGDQERGAETQEFDQDDRRHDRPGHRAEHIRQIEIAEAVRVARILLAHVRHHQRVGRAHADAPRQDRQPQDQRRERQVGDRIGLAGIEQELLPEREHPRHRERADSDQQFDARVEPCRGQAGPARETGDRGSTQPRAHGEPEHEHREDHGQDRGDDPECGERHARPYHLVDEPGEPRHEEESEQQPTDGPAHFAWLVQDVVLQVRSA